MRKDPGSAPRTRPRTFRLKERLADPAPLLTVELRPPRRDLAGVHAMDAWIDVYHAVQRLSNADTVVFLTDNAVGTGEEENLGHLVKNLGQRAERERVVPFLTLKHPLEYCRRYAARARRENFPGLVVLGGDRHDGVPRCLPHAHELRSVLRRDEPGLLLGGWLNPYRDPVEQVSFLVDHAEGLDFALTQVTSHHWPGPVEAVMNEIARRNVDLPLIAGVFYFRSAKPRTLEQLAKFIPVPLEELKRDFGERGLDADAVAAATMRSLAQAGFTRYYISNLPTSRAAAVLSRLAKAAGLPDPLVPRERQGTELP